MSAPADTPPPREGTGADAASSPDRRAPKAANSPVLSMEDRKAERRRQRQADEAGLADRPNREAKLLRMEARRNGRGGRPRAPDPLSQTGEVPPVPTVATVAAPRSGKARAIGSARRRSNDDTDEEFDGVRPLAGAGLSPVAPQPASRARTRTRHWGVLLSFFLCVALPTAVAAWYLWERASPRYASTVGFSVRTEEAASAIDMLGGMMALGNGGSSSTDTDILYRYIQSQEIVKVVDDRLGLRSLWAKGDAERDPVFVYHAPGTIEDLHDYWERMVAVYNDSGTGLLDVQVQAFDPDDARAISQAIYEESQRLINQLSKIALEDKTRLAREELGLAVERLKAARAAVTQFRNLHQIVDPSASLQSQMGLMARLEEQLAQTLIELDLLRQTASNDDPRVEQAFARVDVIQARIFEERTKLGLGRGAPAAEGAEAAEPLPGSATDGEAFADLVADYERLMVDQEFAQQAYITALAAYDAAVAEGRQQSRYLAAHVEPTLAERADYPQRWSLTLLTLLFAGLAWMMLTLGIYALRDRR